MRTLVQKLWVPENRRTIVCVDSYQDGIFRGWLYGPDSSVHPFSSLSHFLVTMEALLEQKNEPQSDTARRSFTAFLHSPGGGAFLSGVPKGRRATFELQILFRQHTSWQGTLLWKERHRQQRFRSVLELILLMDSALRCQEGRDAG